MQNASALGSTVNSSNLQPDTRSELQNEVLSILKSKDYSERQKRLIHTIVTYDIDYDEKILFIIVMDPCISEDILSQWSTVISLFLKYKISRGIIEKLSELKSIDSEYLSNLCDMDLSIWDNSKEQFIENVFWYIFEGDTSVLSTYKPTSESDDKIDTYTWSQKLSPIVFKDFEKKVKKISEEKWLRFDTKEVKGWGMNFYFGKGKVINIWSNCMWKKHIYQQQQQKTMKFLWCSRQEWLNA